MTGHAVTQAEWAECVDPAAMIEFVRGRASDRKVRLFGCACVRLVWSMFDGDAPPAVRVVEDYADGSASKGAMRRARWSVRDERLALEEAGAEHQPRWGACWLTETAATLSVFSTVAAELKRLCTGVLDLKEADWRAICDRLRDIHPEPSPSFDPTWRTPAVQALAASLYADRSFDRLPALADALQEAGCDDAAILDHCRSDRTHVPGCWVVDSALGRE